MDEAKRRRRIVDQLEKMVASGKVTEVEAAQIRAAESTTDFDAAIVEIRMRHAGARLDAAVDDGAMSEAEADGFRKQLHAGEHPRGLRSHLHKLRPGGSRKH